MNIETRINQNEFEQNAYQEIEKKFVPKNAELFEQWRSSAVDITQMYLSNPEDEYSLRLRRTVDLDDNEKYSATIKSRGNVSSRGLERLEVETPISEETFMRYFETNKYPVLFKKRAAVGDGVTIDWIEGSDTPLIEVENIGINEQASEFLSSFESELIDRTGELDVDNESLAHELSGRHLERQQTTSIEKIMDHIVGYKMMGIDKLVIALGGRSGSGKSTLGRELFEAIQTHPMLSETPAFFSTDDYHRGKKYLEETYGAPWTNWEDARVYDTESAAADVKKLHNGIAVQKRRFDFEKEEVVYESTIEPASIVIVEGIHASSEDLAAENTLYYEVKTPLSTSLGRDLTRLMTTNRPSGSIATPESRLQYILEIGEPTYANIKGVERNVFSASARPMASKALSSTIELS